MDHQFAIKIILCQCQWWSH